jgi:hypothetical protein
MDRDRNYKMTIKNDRLFFTTSSFTAEKGSVLHKGVYTKEFSSMLFASAVCIFAYLLIYYTVSRIIYIHLLIIIFLFVVSFLVSRAYLFRERVLELLIDKPNKNVRMSRSGILGKKPEDIHLDAILTVEVGSRTFTPENIDGIKFVQKISLQHGSEVPGLGDAEEFITLSLKLKDGTERIFYVGRIEDEPELPLNDIKNFLKK